MFDIIIVNINDLRRDCRLYEHIFLFVQKYRIELNVNNNIIVYI